MSRRTPLVAALLLAAATMLCGFILITSSTPLVESVFDGTACNGARPSFFNVVPAVNYDCGGQGLGYNVPNPGNPGVGGNYRPDHVNFENNASFTPPFDLGFNVSPVSYNYMINIPQPGPYTITMNLASPDQGGSWNVFLDGGTTAVTTISTPNTGSYQTYQSSTSPQFTATQGNHTLTFAWGAGNNLDHGAGNFVNWQGAQVQSGGGIACAVGPNYTGTIPAGAQAAGFTQCAGNYDFSVTGNFTSPGSSGVATYNWATLSSWLDCAGASNWLLWFNPSTGGGSCADVKIQTDSVTGKQTLFQSVAAANSPQGSGVVLQNELNSYVTGTGPGTAYPEGVYIDMYYRWEGILTAYNQETLVGGPYTVSKNCCAVDFFEWDWNEQAMKPGLTFGYTGSHNVGWGNFTGQGTNVGDQHEFWQQSSFNPTQYQNYGIRITTDGNTNWSMCSYLSGTFLGCGGVFTASKAVAVADQPNDVKFSVLTGNLANDIHLWTQRLTIWTCPSWSPSNQTGQCNNSPVLSGPP